MIDSTENQPTTKAISNERSTIGRDVANSKQVGGQSFVGGVGLYGFGMADGDSNFDEDWIGPEKSKTH